MEKNLQALGYGPNSPIYRLAKKKKLNDDEHDAYMEIVKVGSEGKVLEFFVQMLKKNKKTIEKILKGLMKKGLIKEEGNKYMANFAKAECTLADLRQKIEELGIPVKDNKIKKSDINKALAALSLKRIAPVKNYSFKPFGVDTWGKFYKKYKDQIDGIVGPDNLFGFTLGTFGPINLKNRIVLMDKEGGYFFIKLVNGELVATNHGNIVVV